MKFKWYNDNFEKVAPISFQYVASSSKPDEVTKKIRDFYFGNREITIADWVNITNVIYYISYLLFRLIKNVIFTYIILLLGVYDLIFRE